MTVVTYTLNLGNTASLDIFDDVTHMAFGDDNTAPTISDTTLGNEILRVKLENIEKDTINNKYYFTGRIPITKLNSNTIYEIGLFNASSEGNMSVRLVFPSGFTKTSDDELIFEIMIEIDTINN